VNVELLNVTVSSTTRCGYFGRDNDGAET